MVSARAQFLGAGHFQPLAGALAGYASQYAAAEGLVMEAGAGTAYYLARVLEDLPSHSGLAVDLSKYAARRAAKAHPRVSAIVADMWDRLPIANESVGLALDVFAPRQPQELHRTLRADGALLVVTPTGQHLIDLRDVLGLLNIDNKKEARIAHAFEPYFYLCASRSLNWKMNLTHQNVAALVAMGPSARHVSSSALESRMAGLPDPIQVTAAVTIQVFRAGRHSK